MDLCQRPLAKPLSVLKDKANVKALSFLRSELLFSELDEVFLTNVEGPAFRFLDHQVHVSGNRIHLELPRLFIGFSPEFRTTLA